VRRQPPTSSDASDVINSAAYTLSQTFLLQQVAHTID